MPHRAVWHIYQEAALALASPPQHILAWQPRLVRHLGRQGHEQAVEALLPPDKPSHLCTERAIANEGAIAGQNGRALENK